MDSLFKEKANIEQSKMRKRRKRKSTKAVFIEYQQGQMLLLPPSIEEMIPENHIVRMVNKLIETMNIEALINTYKGGGRSAYDPKMLLKVLLYAYVMKLYTSRRISKALREDVTFMWLSGMQRPNFRTINNFRSGRLKKVIDEIFSSMIIFLSEGKHIKLEHYFVDGTKIEANANKYSYVWASNTKRYKEATVRKINELLKEIDRINEEENKKYGDKDIEELGEEIQDISSEEIEKQVERLNEIIKKIDKKDEDKSEDKEDTEKKQKKKKISKAINQINKKYLPKLKKYEKQEAELKGRNSYSKTDKDATFFRTKDGRLLPSYNIIAGSENQIITNYSIHQKASETDRFIAHIKKLTKTTKGKYPKKIIGDSTYGSEENYEFLKKEGIKNYLKYNSYYQEQKGIIKKKPYHKDNFIYNQKENKYICPEGRELNFVEEQQKQTANGYLQRIKMYKGEGCKNCKVLSLCSKSPKGRTIQLNERLEKYKAEARKNLFTKVGTGLRKQRNIDIETVFADIKQNQGFKRFNLRELENVNAEFGLVAMAHNIRKLTVMVN